MLNQSLCLTSEKLNFAISSIHQVHFIYNHSFSFSDLENMEYRRVFVRGRFDHSKEMFIGPRWFFYL